MISKISLANITSNMASNVAFGARSDKKTSFEQPDMLSKDYFVKRSYTNDGVKVVRIQKATPAAKKEMIRIQELTTPDSDGSVSLIDKNGNVTTLSRPCTSSEIDCASSMRFLNKNDKMKALVDIVDSGLEPLEASKIVTTQDGIKKYMALTTPKEDGSAKITVNDTEYVLSRPLEADEASLIILSKNRKVPPQRFQTYIDLIDDNGLEAEQAFRVARTESNANKFFALTDVENLAFNLSRSLTSEEAYAALELDESKILAFQKLLDSDLDIEDAAYVSRDERRSTKFFNLTEADEAGNAHLPMQDGTTLTLPRALSSKEAMIAIKEQFPAKKIYEQLMNDGSVHSTRRHSVRTIV